MTPNLPCLHLARVAIETTTPLSVGTGLGAGLYDTALVRDANGLPAIPGASIAGVLRHLYRERYPELELDESKLFGRAGKGTEQPSHLHVSWTAIHDCQDRPVEGLALGAAAAELHGDPILRQALEDQPLVRDHVRIGHHGSADGRGKFDRTSLPAGYRFSFELWLWSDKERDSRFGQVLALLRDPAFRLGGATRRGLGRLEVVRLRALSLDLRSAEDRGAFAALPQGLGETPESLGSRAGFVEFAVQEDRSGPLTARIELAPVDFWRMGQGAGKRLTAAGKAADLAPVREPAVEWRDDGHGNERGAMTERRLTVAASGVKGALRHRVAFHHARLTGVWADAMTDADSMRTWVEENDAVVELFGRIKDSGEEDGEAQETGHAGRLLLDDAYLDDQEGWIMPHNSVDRFTGGVRDGFLFSEELAHQGRFAMQLTVRLPGTIGGPARQALRCALDDLIEGRLAIGGGGGKGHGICTGSIAWSDSGAKWIEERP